MITTVCDAVENAYGAKTDVSMLSASRMSDEIRNDIKLLTDQHSGKTLLSYLKTLADGAALLGLLNSEDWTLRIGP